jgi:hypothetical protein
MCQCGGHELHVLYRNFFQPALPTGVCRGVTSVRMISTVQLLSAAADWDVSGQADIFSMFSHTFF